MNISIDKSSNKSAHNKNTSNVAIPSINKAKSTKLQEIKTQKIANYKEKFITAGSTDILAECLAIEVVEIQAICTDNTTEKIKTAISNNDLATKYDIILVQKDIAALRKDIAALQKEISIIQSNLEIKIALVKSDLEGKIAESSNKIIIWTIASFVAANSLLFGMLHLI